MSTEKARREHERTTIFWQHCVGINFCIIFFHNQGGLFALFEAWIGGGGPCVGHLRSCRTSSSRRKLQFPSRALHYGETYVSAPTSRSLTTLSDGTDGHICGRTWPHASVTVRFRQSHQSPSDDHWPIAYCNTWFLCNFCDMFQISDLKRGKFLKTCSLFLLFSTLRQSPPPLCFSKPELSAVVPAQVICAAAAAPPGIGGNSKFFQRKALKYQRTFQNPLSQTMFIPLRRKISSGLARNLEGRAQRWLGSLGRGCLCCCWGIMWQCSVPGSPAIHPLIWMETKTRTVIYLYTYTADILEVLLKCC